MIIREYPLYKVQLLEPNDVEWDLGSEDSTPLYRAGCSNYKRAIKVDPYPAYAPDFPLVCGLAAACWDAFPLTGSELEITCLSHEPLSRINGLTYEDYIYKGKDGNETEEIITKPDGTTKKVYQLGNTIFLSAKRIPIHPAMLRYLVPHEYGHAVFNYASRKLGYDTSDHEKLEAIYASIRGATNLSEKYVGGSWHNNIKEIIANDFRVLFTHQEVEFWPHEVSLPKWNTPIGKWWKKVHKLCGDLSV